MRYMHFTHAVLASLLWAAVVFAFVGMSFMTFDQAMKGLQESRVRLTLSALKQALQTDMDRGNAPLALNPKTEALFFHYTDEDPDLLSVFVFDRESGRILFSTSAERAGMKVPEKLAALCRSAENFVDEAEKERVRTALPLINAFNEKTGCVAAEYETYSYENGRHRMMRIALRSGLLLTLIGTAVCLLLYFARPFLATFPLIRRPVYRHLILWGSLILLLCAVPASVSGMFSSFETVLRKNIALKTQVIARRVQTQVERAVQKGIPFKSLKSAEVWLEGIRQKNPEVMFILLTDKSGRVLYEAGSAAEAFRSDPRTGKVSLRRGYYNAAEPIGMGKANVGWVQIGVKERFVREKIY